MPRCGTCKWGEPTYNDITSVGCYGGPPQVVLRPVMTPAGAQIQVQMMRPCMARSERACAVYQPKEIANEPEVLEPHGVAVHPEPAAHSVSSSVSEP